jgi:signal peptidase II
LNVNFREWVETHKLFLFYVLIVILIIIFDQWTKSLIIKNVILYEVLPVNSFINITHQENAGAAFSILSNAGGWQRWFLSVLAICISVYIVFWLFRLRNQDQIILSIGLSLVLGGAIGNVIDRIQFGYVIDYIQVLIMGWPFPSFNIADASITVGAVILIIDALFISKNSVFN